VLAWKKIPWSDEIPVLSDDVPEHVNAGVGSAGVGTEVSRDDHVHQVDVGSPVALDGIAGDGTSDNLIRADHKHDLGTMADDIDMGQHSLSRQVIETSEIIPVNPVEGQVYYDLGDNHVYVYAVE